MKEIKSDKYELNLMSRNRKLKFNYKKYVLRMEEGILNMSQVYEYTRTCVQRTHTHNLKKPKIHI